MEKKRKEGGVAAQGARIKYAGDKTVNLPDVPKLPEPSTPEEEASNQCAMCGAFSCKKKWMKSMIYNGKRLPEGVWCAECADIKETGFNEFEWDDVIESREDPFFWQMWLIATKTHIQSKRKDFYTESAEKRRLSAQREREG